MHKENPIDFSTFIHGYLQNITTSFDEINIQEIANLSKTIYNCWVNKQRVFLCGNGGSAANALHIANDFIYGVGVNREFNNLAGLDVEALTSNSAVVTCLANDTGYDNIFAKQLFAKGSKDDLLIVLSGSGNSKNIEAAILCAKTLGMRTAGIFAFEGGTCLDKVDIPIHFKINDMQVAEDLQLIVGHMCMKWLNAKRFNCKHV